MAGGVAAISARPQGFAQPLVVLAALLAGCAVGVAPEAAVLVTVGALGAALIVAKSLAELLAVVFGALLAFGGEEVGVGKVAYLALVVALLITAPAVVRLARVHDGRGIASVVAVHAVASLVFLTNLAVAKANGVDALAWLRDATPYLLLAAAPILALRVGPRLRPDTIACVFLAAYAASLAVFTVSWLSRRGVLDITPPGLSSLVFCAAGIIVSTRLATTATGRRRLILLALAVVGPLALFATGTRSALLILIALPFVHASSGATATTAARRAPAALLVVALLTPFSVVLAQHSPLLQDRVELLLRVVHDPSADASLSERRTTTGMALAMWRENPVVGAGGGTPFVHTAPGGHVIKSTTVDTVLATPSKYGIVGVLAVFATIFATVRLIGLAAPRGWPRDSLRGLLVFATLLAPLGNPLEDKGLFVALVLLISAAIAEGRRRAA